MTRFITGLAIVSLVGMAVCNIIKRNVDDISFIEICSSVFFILAITFLLKDNELAKRILKSVIILNVILMTLMVTSLKTPKILCRLFNALALVVEAILLAKSSSVNIIIVGIIGILPIIMLTFCIVDYYLCKKNRAKMLR